MRHGVLTLGLCVATACGGRSVPSVPRAPVVASYELPAVVEQLPASVTVTATGADVYSAQSPSAESPDALFDAIRAALPTTELVHDNRLDSVASDVAQLPPDVRASKAFLDFELHAHGVAEPLIGGAVAADGDPASVVAALLPQLSSLTAHGWISLGIARAHDRAVVVVTHRVRFFGERVPRSLPLGGRVEIAGTLAPEYRNPELAITEDDLAPVHASFRDHRDMYSTSISCTRPSTMWLTITARDRLGDEPILASFPIACGSAPPRSYVTEVQAAVDATDVGRRLAALINRNRAVVGAAPLARDTRAERAATEWATDMDRKARVAHAIDGATSTSRLREQGLIPARSAHLAFHADDLQQAVELLENDDSYRSLLLDRDLSHIGIGVVPDSRGGFYAALELLQVPSRIDANAEQARLSRIIRDSLSKHYRLWESPAIASIAQWYATQLALGWSPESLDLWMARKIRATHAPSFQAIVRTPPRIDALDWAALIPKGTTYYVGVGVVQSPANSALANRIVVVLLFGD